MPRLTRVHQKVFASNASNNGVFGSLQAGNPQTSNDVATLQSLAAFENGWDDAIEQGDKLPPLEEFQGVQYGISYQQAYMLQEGIAEWDASTTYYKGSLTKSISGTSFKLYCSLQDNNTGNVVTNTSYWKLVMDSDAGYAILNANQTFTGNNTFSGTTNAVTPNASDNSTKVATTAWFNLADVKKMIVGLMMPDYASATGITFPDNTHEYTAPSNGYLMMSFYRNEDELIYGYINGVVSPFAYNDMLNGQLNMQYSIPLSKGDKFYWNSSMSGVVVNSCYFVPCVGG